MSFMERDVTPKQHWISADSPEDIVYVPVNVVGSLAEVKAAIEAWERDDDGKPDREPPALLSDYLPSRVWSLEIVKGYGARLSAPGYLDCTEWAVFQTAKAAETYLEETFGDDDED